MNHFAGVVRFEELNGMETLKSRQEKDESLRSEELERICNNFELEVLTT